MTSSPSVPDEPRVPLTRGFVLFLLLFGLGEAILFVLVLTALLSSSFVPTYGNDPRNRPTTGQGVSR